jgi:hypothetical protein
MRAVDDLIYTGRGDNFAWLVQHRYADLSSRETPGSVCQSAHKDSDFGEGALSREEVRPRTRTGGSRTTFPFEKIDAAARDEVDSALGYAFLLGPTKIVVLAHRMR